MTIVLLLFIASCLVTAKYKNPFSNDSFKNNFEKDSTTCINGIFVVLVFLSHFHFEIENFYKIDSVYLKFQMICGQCVVCSFLFYSGYGIYENLKKNRATHSRKLILSKFPKLLLRFDICVLLYAIAQFCIGNHSSLKEILLSLLTIKSLGNSNWYISYILLMYLVIWLTFRVFKNDNIALCFVTFANIAYTILFVFFDAKDSHYYVTSFVLPLGMYFSMYKEKIEKFINKRIFLCFIIFFSLYVASWILKVKFVLPEYTYNIVSLLFTSTLILATYKIQINNKILLLLGKNVFQIYILQHLPMMILKPIQNYGGVHLISFTLCHIDGNFDFDDEFCLWKNCRIQARI